MLLSCNKFMIKLVISDIDGTLVPDGSGEGVINPEYFSVIEKLAEKGVSFCACSGRQFASMYKVFRPVADKIFFICEGGGFVCQGERNVLNKSVLPPETAREIILDAMEISQVDIMVAGIKKSYCRYKDSELYRWMVDGYGFDMDAVGDILNNIDDDIAKVSLYHHDAVEMLTKDKFKPKWEKRVKAVYAGIQWLDMVSNESGKGVAASFLQKHLGVTPDETMVFGDNQNDIEMFEKCTHSYAVAGAREETRVAANNVCPPMEEDGVLQVLKSLL